jgi:hypothetical protein
VSDVVTIEPGPARDAWLALLELADEPAQGGGVGQLAFYQRLGFRLTHVERDFFTPDRGYPEGLTENGSPTRDMAWMDLDRS